MRLLLVIVIALIVQSAAAQTTEATHRTARTTVSGVVNDSVARKPLTGAIVQLVAADSTPGFGRTAVSDALGRFEIDSVPDGLYMLGFFHPRLDSLGLEPTLRQVRVDGAQPVRADLGVPSRARVRAALCGGGSVRDSSGVIVGFVRDAESSAPVEGVTVTAEWLEISLRPEGVVRNVPSVRAMTSETGWFALCNVPRPGTIAVLASRGADSTDLLEVEVPPDGFLSRELYLGHARNIVASDTPTRAGNVSAAPRRAHSGDGRLSGTVVTAADERPVGGAQVSISGGPETRANERGEWTLADVPTGTRTLEVRALGFYPHRRTVAVLSDAAPVRVTLSTLKAVLDTVRITAARVRPGNLAGFQQRRRNGLGRFLTTEDIARRSVNLTSEIFQTVPGFKGLLMRGAFDDCSPAIFVDNHRVASTDSVLRPEDIDMWVKPGEIAGIEIYYDFVPAQFQQGLGGCGSVVIWTK